MPKYECHTLLSWIDNLSPWVPLFHYKKEDIMRRLFKLHLGRLFVLPRRTDTWVLGVGESER